jgi:hypothetical protein
MESRKQRKLFGKLSGCVVSSAAYSDRSKVDCAAFFFVIRIQ